MNEALNDFEAQLKQWRALEYQALAAEERIKGVQPAGSPEFAQLALEAKQRRRAADDFLGSVLCTAQNNSRTVRRA